jgi:hypothetical protein
MENKKFQNPVKRPSPILATLTVSLIASLVATSQAEIERDFQAIKSSLTLKYYENRIRPFNIEHDYRGLKTGWFTFEDEIITRRTQRTGKIGDFLAVTMMSTEAILLFKENPFFQIWPRLDVNDGEFNYEFDWERGMVRHDVFVADDDNQITAADSVGASSIVTVALQNLTILTFDLAKYGTDEDVILSQFDTPPNIFFDNEIKALSSPPHEDFVIFSPNVKEIFKVNKFDSSDYMKNDLKINRLRFIVSPAPADTPVYDIYRQEFKDDPEISQRVKTATNIPYFVATGDEVGINMVGDWTTLETVATFLTIINPFNETTTKRAMGYDNQFTVRAITHLGFHPMQGLYAYIPTLNDKNYNNVYFHSTVSQSTQLGYVYPDTGKITYLHWVNQTSFVLLYFGNEGDVEYYDFSYNQLYYSSISNVYRDLGYFDQASFKIHFGSKDQVDKGYITGSIFLTFNMKVMIGHHDFPWEECDDMFHRGQHSQKIYSKYKVCEIPNFHSEKLEENVFEDGIVKNWRQKKTCADGEVLHFALKEEHKPKRNPPLQMSEFKEFLREGQTYFELACFPYYTLSDELKYYENDNGCQPGYDKYKPLGICFLCPTFYNDFDSSCGLTQFYNLRTYYIDDYLFSSLSPVSIFNFTYDKLETKFPVKGMELYGKQSYKHLYFEKSDMISLSQQKVSVAYYDDMIEVNAVTSQLGRLKTCYVVEVVNEENRQSYQVNVNFPYEFKNRKEYNIEADEVQTGIIPGLRLEEEFCWLNCTEIVGPGHFFVYESLSCLQCKDNCVQCRDFESCELCNPGFNIIQQPKFRELKNSEKTEVCIQGCQSGFFSRLYDGNCQECSEYCQVCSDASGTKYGLFTGEGDYCWKCKEQDRDGRSLALYSKFRICAPSDECQHELREVVIEFEGEEAVQTYCIECEEGCLECDYMQSDKCLRCDEDYELIASSCVRLKEDNIFENLMIFITLFLLLFVLFFLVLRKIKENRRKDLEVSFFFIFKEKHRKVTKRLSIFGNVSTKDSLKVR